MTMPDGGNLYRVLIGITLKDQGVLLWVKKIIPLYKYRMKMRSLMQNGLINVYQPKLNGNMQRVAAWNKQIIIGVMNLNRKVKPWQIHLLVKNFLLLILLIKIKLAQQLLQATQQMVTDYMIWQEMCGNG